MFHAAHKLTCGNKYEFVRIINVRVVISQSNCIYDNKKIISFRHNHLNENSCKRYVYIIIAIL